MYHATKAVLFNPKLLSTAFTQHIGKIKNGSTLLQMQEMQPRNAAWCA
jgi:hypothetical protein